MLNSVSTINCAFWLNNWNKTMFLANGCVLSKTKCNMMNSLIRWFSVTKLDYRSPFGKSTSSFIVSCSHIVKIIKSFCESFIWTAWDWSLTFINFNTTQDSFFGQKVNKSSSISSFMTSCLFKHNSPTDILFKTFSCED